MKVRRHTLVTRKNKLDQFYTKLELADKVVEHVLKLIPLNKREVFFEPSAGSGSFLIPLKNRELDFIATDLDPKCDDCLEANFLELTQDDFLIAPPSNVCVIGNPPFGKCSNLAVRFFNHACFFGDTIAFILPRTFKKKSIHNKLNAYYSLDFQEDTPKKSFVLDDKEYDVPCVFQIWSKKKDPRKMYSSMPDCFCFSFVSKEEAEFCVRRVGGRAGQLIDDLKGSSPSSNYYLKTKEGFSLNDIFNIWNGIDFSDVVNSTAGQRSLSKHEMIERVNEYVQRKYNLQ